LAGTLSFCSNAAAAQQETKETQEETAQAKRSISVYNPPETPEEAAERVKKPILTLAPERMKVAPLPPRVPVGQPLRFTVTMAPGKLAWNSITGSISVSQIGPNGKGITGSIPANIVSEDGPTKIIEAIPMGLGEVTFEVFAGYHDNAVAKQQVKSYVYPTAKGLRLFSLGTDRLMHLVLPGHELHERETQLPRQQFETGYLNPRLSYEGLKTPIIINGVVGLPITIEQPADNPVIRVDDDGTVHALNPGKAVIVCDIEGKTDRIPVVVD
jgi:hypothetical protein